VLAFPAAAFRGQDVASQEQTRPEGGGAKRSFKLLLNLTKTDDLVKIPDVDLTEARRRVTRIVDSIKYDLHFSVPP
jgi:hypothetical protein